MMQATTDTANRHYNHWCSPEERRGGRLAVLFQFWNSF